MVQKIQVSTTRPAHSGRPRQVSIQGTDEFVGEVMDDFRDALNSKTEWYGGTGPTSRPRIWVNTLKLSTHHIGSWGTSETAP